MENNYINEFQKLINDTPKDHVFHKSVNARVTFFNEKRLLNNHLNLKTWCLTIGIDYKTNKIFYGIGQPVTIKDYLDLTEVEKIEIINWYKKDNKNMKNLLTKIALKLILSEDHHPVLEWIFKTFYRSENNY